MAKGSHVARGVDTSEVWVMKLDIPSSKCLSAAVPEAVERLFFGVCPLVSLNMFHSPGPKEPPLVEN